MAETLMFGNSGVKLDPANVADRLTEAVAEPSRQLLSERKTDNDDEIFNGSERVVGLDRWSTADGRLRAEYDEDTSASDDPGDSNSNAVFEPDEGVDSEPAPASLDGIVSPNDAGVRRAIWTIINAAVVAGWDVAQSGEFASRPSPMIQ